MTREGQLPKSDIKETRHRTNKWVKLFILPLLVTLASCGSIDSKSSNNPSVQAGKPTSVESGSELEGVMSQTSGEIEYNGQRVEYFKCQFNTSIVKERIGFDQFQWSIITHDDLLSFDTYFGSRRTTDGDVSVQQIVFLLANDTSNLPSEEDTKSILNLDANALVYYLPPPNEDGSNKRNGMRIIITPLENIGIFGEPNTARLYSAFCYFRIKN